MLNTDGTITGADAIDYQFGAVAGEMDIRRRGPPLAAQIVAENITSAGGLNVDAIVCKFHNTPDRDCTVPFPEQLRGRRRVLLGIGVTTTQVHRAGDSASVTFDFTVTLL